MVERSSWVFKATSQGASVDRRMPSNNFFFKLEVYYLLIIMAISQNVKFHFGPAGLEVLFTVQDPKSCLLELPPACVQCAAVRSEI